MSLRPSARAWLSERRRAGTSVAFALVVRVAIGASSLSISGTDAFVLTLLAYLSAYLVLSSTAFRAATATQIHDWARRDSRGTFLQRYVLGTAPGPGVSMFPAGAAFAVAVLWLPGRTEVSVSDTVRIAVGVALIVVAWLCVVVSFAVTFYADNVVEDELGLSFPGDHSAEWADYVYFAISLMTTLGTTDVRVMSRAMRRTVSANAAIAFVFNAVTIATAVSVIGAG